MKLFVALFSIILLSPLTAISQSGIMLQVERLTSGPAVDFTDFPDFAAIHIRSGVMGLKIKSEVSEVMRIAISSTETLLIVTPTNQRVVFDSDEYGRGVLEIASMRPRQAVWVRVRVVEDSVPFSLEWEGDIVRAPLQQPLPNYNEEVEAVISVRFQVMPNGTVNEIVPLHKMSPSLEKEVLSTIRSWRFARLPSGVPQDPQWGTITFRFVLR
jgi:TonB family protein